jgi:hypothetical protein
MYVEHGLNILQGKSSQDLKCIVCVVIENLFAEKHMAHSYTRSLILTFIDVCDKVFPEANNPTQITSMVQCLTQIYLNLNSGTPFLAKELLSRIIDLLGEILSMDPADITYFDESSINMIKNRVSKNIELIIMMSCDEYLFPEEEAMEFLGGMSMEENVLDAIR